MFDQQELLLRLPDSLPADTYGPIVFTLPEDQMDVISQALQHPLGNFTFDEFQKAKQIVIAINDKTRPIPYKKILPPLLDKLKSIGIPNEAITFLIASGTHTPMPVQEFPRIVSEEIIKNFPIVAHNADAADDMVDLGKTSRGTYVEINRIFMESDFRIVTGNIEPHHFAGYSGGAKTAAIGLAGRSTITQNHTLLLNPESTIGAYDTNPLRQDIEEIGSMIGIHLALNVILNENKQVLNAFCGTPKAVIQSGILVARDICQTPVKQKYDLVFASAGGSPKDINFYQAQKALTHASLIAKDGGVIVLVAACPEGVGSFEYEKFMEGIQSTDELFEKFEREGFQIGPHKAFMIGRQLRKFRIILISKMAREKVRQLLLEPATNLEEALSMALATLPPSPSIAILPNATHTIPTFPS